jgi:hypothetical protein
VIGLALNALTSFLDEFDLSLLSIFVWMHCLQQVALLHLPLRADCYNLMLTRAAGVNQQRVQRRCFIIL